MSQVPAMQHGEGATTSAALLQSFDQRSDRWDALLDQQVNLFSTSEIAFLEQLPCWQSAESVLDVGCGNGSYLAQLHDAFPEKRFSGIERSEELLDIARHRLLHRNVRLYQGDIVNRRPDKKFDVVILRFVAQHLDNPIEFFDCLHRFCHSETSVLIIEPNPSRSAAMPELFGLKELISRYELVCKSMQGTRANLKDANGLAVLLGDSWDITYDTEIESVHQRSSWNGQAVANVLDGWVELLECVNGLNIDFPAVHSEISEWVQQRGESIGITLNMWVLQSCRSAGLKPITQDV